MDVEQSYIHNYDNSVAVKYGDPNIAVFCTSSFCFTFKIMPFAHVRNMTYRHCQVFVASIVDQPVKKETSSASDNTIEHCT